MTPLNQHPDPQRVFAEFSPKILLRQTGGALRYLLSKWWIILSIALVAGLIGAAYSHTKKVTYATELTFTLDEGVSPDARSGSSELEALGIGPLNDAGGFFSSMTNIVELMQSRLLIEKTLRRTITIEGHQLQFADFFLDSLQFRDKWMKNSPYYHINFLTPKKNKKDSLFENSIMRAMYDILSGSIRIDKKGKSTTIISVKMVSTHELFTKYFLEALVDEVANYYVEIKTQRAKNNLSFLQKRVDSVKTAYNFALYGRASFQDEHVNPILQVATVSREKQQTDIQILRASYVELVRDLESAKTALMRDTPLIQLLDIPILPLRGEAPRTMVYFMTLAFLGAMLTIAWLLFRKTLKYLLR